MKSDVKRCLITGATNGLGQFCAAALAEDGWDVIAQGRRSAEDAQMPSSIQYFSADFSSEAETTKFANDIQGCPDLVVHCGVTYPPATSNIVPEDLEVSRIFNVNTFAPIRISEVLLQNKPDMKAATFIFVNSEAMFSSDASSGVYAASKAALRVLTASFADRCRGKSAASSTLLLGPLGSQKKRDELKIIADKHGLSIEELTKRFLSKSNPNLMIDGFIEHDLCLKSILYMESLGQAANGMMCRLDGGSAGSLI